MNWKTLQDDEGTVVSHLHLLLSVSMARREMDSAASNSHNEGLVGL